MVVRSGGLHLSPLRGARSACERSEPTGEGRPRQEEDPSPAALRAATSPRRRGEVKDIRTPPTDWSRRGAAMTDDPKHPTPPPDDGPAPDPAEAELVAYLDGELDPAAARAVE